MRQPSINTRRTVIDRGPELTEDKEQSSHGPSVAERD